MLAPTLMIAWVLATPFVAGVLIARSPRIRRGCVRVYPLSLATGWLGLALLAAGALALDGPAAAVALAAGGPLAGLSFWSRRFDDWDDGGHSDRDDEPTPPGDGVDWDEFERRFRDYATRERVPAGHT